MVRVELKLLPNEPPYTFVSLGIHDRLNDIYLPSEDFPIGTTYKLIEGEFPFRSVQYNYNHIFKGPNGKIAAKVITFDYACRTGVGASVSGERMSCTISIQRPNTPQTGGKQMRGKQMGGRKTRGGRTTNYRRKNKSKRNKSKRK